MKLKGNKPFVLRNITSSKVESLVNLAILDAKLGIRVAIKLPVCSRMHQQDGIIWVTVDPNHVLQVLENVHPSARYSVQCTKFPDGTVMKIAGSTLV